MNQILSLIVSKLGVSRVRSSKTATLLIGCCVALSGTPLYAQVGSQANTLLEVQALRQEVAQLRDMVERQQYELRKMQRLLQKEGAVTSINQQGISSTSSDLINSQPPSTLVTNEYQPDSRALNNTLTEPLSAPSVDNNTGAIDASVAPVVPTKVATRAPVIEPTNPSTTTQTVTQGSNVVKLNEKTYPPVVEIAVGDAAPKPQEITQVQANDSLASGVTNQVVNQVNASSTQVGQVIEQNVSPAVVSAPGISVVDIKPIETISAGSIVSVPAAQQPVSSTVEAAIPNNQADAKTSFSVISESDYYQQGFGLLKESKHQEAVTVFQQQIKSYPQGERADDAYYWIAESMYVNRKLSIAKENYKAIVQGYPKSERLPDAMLKLAYIEQEQGNIIEARILLQEIMQFHPKSDAALSAKNRLSELN